jgi:hypothetical protein
MLSVFIIIFFDIIQFILVALKISWIQIRDSSGVTYLETHRNPFDWPSLLSAQNLTLEKQ